MMMHWYCYIAVIFPFCKEIREGFKHVDDGCWGGGTLYFAPLDGRIQSGVGSWGSLHTAKEGMGIFIHIQ